MESIIEEDREMKNFFRNKILKVPISIREAASKKNVDTSFNDPSMITNTARVDFNDKNLDNVRFIKMNSLPAVSHHLTHKHYVDNAIHEGTLVRYIEDN